jgi:hypothetical protein
MVATTATPLREVSDFPPLFFLSHRMELGGPRVRRLTVICAVVSMFVGVLAIPALADEPATFAGSITFPDDNPCTTEFDPVEHMVTINVEGLFHEHQNNYVEYTTATGSTDSGFTMLNSTSSLVANNGVERGVFLDLWHHPDGSKFVAQGHFTFNFNTGELLVDSFRLRCLGKN